MRKAKILIKMLVFPLICTLIFCGIQTIFTVKATPSSGIVSQFYDLPEDSVDVLFLGSCNIYNNVSTVTLWEEYGISAYNFATSDQSMCTSYYFLKSALSRQQPKLVVIDVLMLIEYLEITEENYRWALDYMPLNKTKLEFSQAIYGKGGSIDRANARKQDLSVSEVVENSGDATLNILSGLFPMLRYHDRWLDIGKDDFTSAPLAEPALFMGFEALFPSVALTVRSDYMDESRELSAYTVSISHLLDEAVEYLAKIQTLCEQEGIPLLLIKTPTAHYWNLLRSQNVTELAAEMGLEFIDYNLLTDAFGLDWSTDTYTWEGRRLNARGAEKFTRYLGENLLERWPLPDRRSEEAYTALWTPVMERYREEERLYALTQENDLAGFLEVLADYTGHYEVIVSYYGDGENLSAALLEALGSLGFCPQKSADGRLLAYIGIMDRTGMLYEESSPERYLTYNNAPFPDFLIQVQNTAIGINHNNFTRVQGGLAIVVYDRQENRLIDAVGCSLEAGDELIRSEISSDIFAVPAGSP